MIVRAAAKSKDAGEVVNVNIDARRVSDREAQPGRSMAISDTHIQLRSLTTVTDIERSESETERGDEEVK